MSSLMRRSVRIEQQRQNKYTKRKRFLNEKVFSKNKRRCQER